jgi:predicted enzyme related to lactoylglutathione lyase
MTLTANPVSWFEIYTQDLERAKTFYESVFGYVLSPEPNDGSFKAYRFPGAMPGYGAMGALMHHPMRGPSPEGHVIYFHCDNCDTRAQLAVQHGGQIHRQKWSIGPDGFIALIGDTEGNVIGLHSFE